MGSTNFGHNPYDGPILTVYEWACEDCGEKKCKCSRVKQMWRNIWWPTEEFVFEVWDRLVGAYRVLRHGVQ